MIKRRHGVSNRLIKLLPLSNFFLCANQQCDKGTSGQGVAVDCEHQHVDLLNQQIVSWSVHPQSMEF